MHAQCVITTEPGSRGPAVSLSTWSVVLAGTPERSFEGDDDAVVEVLTAPHAPGLVPLQGAGQASLSYGAVAADHLCPFDVGGGVGEEQVRVGSAARQLPVDGDGQPLVQSARR